MSNQKKKILEKIKKKSAKIGVVGAGYVGIPLLKIFKKRGFSCLAFDLKENINSIKSKNKNINITYDYSFLKNLDIIIYTLPTPLNLKKKPDLSILKNSLEKSLKYFKPGQLIIIESTSYPGTTRELVKNINKKFEIGGNIFVCFSSERVDPGNKKFTIEKIPKIISGYHNNCLDVISTFYSKIFYKVIKAKNLETAEFSKIFENVFRSVNISLVNEFKELSEKLKINFYEVNELASSKPFGFMKFNPGIGAGGHCIPIDPVYLQWKFKMHGLNSHILDSSIKYNQKYSNVITNKIKKILNNNKILNKKNKVLVLGLSYKKDVDDLRHSPALEIFLNLRKYIDSSYHDPYIPNIRLKGKKLNSINLNNDLTNLRKFSAVIFLVNHSYYNDIKNKIVDNSKIIIDGTNTINFTKCKSI